MSARISRYGRPVEEDKPAPAKGSAGVQAIAQAAKETPEVPAFLPDRTATHQQRMGALLDAQLSLMEDRLSRGEDLSVLELQRLADAVEGRATVDAPKAAGHYDYDRLTEDEFNAMDAALRKAWVPA